MDRNHPTFQSYLRNIHTRTGKTPDDFKALAGERGLLQRGTTASQVVAWLKQDHGLGHGHAMAIYAVLKPSISAGS